MIKKKQRHKQMGREQARKEKEWGMGPSRTFSFEKEQEQFFSEARKERVK